MLFMLAHVYISKKNEQKQATGIPDMSVLVVKNFMLPLSGKNIQKKAFVFDIVERLN